MINSSIFNLKIKINPVKHFNVRIALAIVCTLILLLALGILAQEPDNISTTIAEYNSKSQILENKIREVEKLNDSLRQTINRLEEKNKFLASQFKKTGDASSRNWLSIFKLIILITAVTLIAIGILVLRFFYLKQGRKKKNSSSKNLVMQNRSTNSIQNVQTIADDDRKKKQNQLRESDKPILPQNKNLSHSNILSKSFNVKAKKSKWYIVGASSIGKSHLVSNKPCQDNHYSEYWDNGWGIAITSDGAGSAECSHYGSEYIATISALNNFKNFAAKKKWAKKNYLPTTDEWSGYSTLLLKQVYHDLEHFALKNNYPFASVACTIIVVIFSPTGLLVTHIGDGRAGYRNEKGEWKPAITPHKGEESNSTIFITSNAWISDSQLLMSNVRIPESRVIQEKITAFTLMSDGCEAHSFECSAMNGETNQWNDPNIPYTKFFDPVCHQLKSMCLNNTGMDEANEKWKKFMEDGTTGLKEESDDKTMIVGILIS